MWSILHDQAHKHNLQCPFLHTLFGARDQSYLHWIQASMFAKLKHLVVVQRVQGHLHWVWACMFADLKGNPNAVLLPVQLKEAADFREVKLKGKNHILKTGHYRLKNELKSDHKKVEQLQEQVRSGSFPVILEVHHRLGSLTFHLHPGSFI